jgi:phosphatidylethanolamine N-methyltransferase
LPEMVPIEQTPAATDGETDAEPELQDLEPDAPGPRVTIMRSDSTASNGSFGTSSAQAKSSTAGSSTPGKMRRKSVSMHDLTNRFFRKPVVVLSNLDVFR